MLIHLCSNSTAFECSGFPRSPTMFDCIGRYAGTILVSKDVSYLMPLLKMVWPSASRAWELLNGVQVGSANSYTLESSDRHKRPAEAAFGQEKSSDYLQREVFHDPTNVKATTDGQNGVQELGTRIMAHMLGLNIPGIEASTSYYPGYEWWPRSYEETPPSSHQISPSPSDPRNLSPSNNVIPSSGNLMPDPGVPEWTSGDANYSYNFDARLQ